MTLAADDDKANVSSKPVQTGVSAVTQAAVQAGVLSCAERINQVTNFLTANSNSGAFLFLSSPQPDESVFSASLEIEIQGKEDSTAYASMSFAPNQANGCGALYETVVYWPIHCKELETKQFAGLKPAGAIRKGCHGA